MVLKSSTISGMNGADAGVDGAGVDGAGVDGVVRDLRLPCCVAGCELDARTRRLAALDGDGMKRA
jgi:hypothetical protein